MKFGAIKRVVNNDYSKREHESYKIQMFESKPEAVNWLVNNYEFYEDHNCGDWGSYQKWDIKWTKDQIGWQKLYDFFINAKPGDVMFHWEWERRGNFRSYWINEIAEDGTLSFYANAETLYSFYKQEIMEKSIVDKYKE